jgi:hypothetical protein
MPPTTTDKVTENRIRRAAKRQGLALRKPRRRDPRALDFGDYWLLRYFVRTPGGIEAVADPEGTDDCWLGPFADLDEVEAWLDADPDTRPDIGDRRAAGEFWLDDWRRRKQPRRKRPHRKGA